VRWVVTLANTGDVTLRGILVDSAVDGCNHRVRRLAPGSEPVRLTCTAKVGASAVTNMVTVTGRVGSAEAVRAVAAGTADVPRSGGLGGPGLPARSPVAGNAQDEPPAPPASPGLPPEPGPTAPAETSAPPAPVTPGLPVPTVPADPGPSAPVSIDIPPP
jgi:hypothetical protein